MVESFGLIRPSLLRCFSPQRNVSGFILSQCDVVVLGCKQPHRVHHQSSSVPAGAAMYIIPPSSERTSVSLTTTQPRGVFFVLTRCITLQSLISDVSPRRFVPFVSLEARVAGELSAQATQRAHIPAVSLSHWPPTQHPKKRQGHQQHGDPPLAPSQARLAAGTITWRVIHSIPDRNHLMGNKPTSERINSGKI